MTTRRGFWPRRRTDQWMPYAVGIVFGLAIAGVLGFAELRTRLTLRALHRGTGETRLPSFGPLTDASNQRSFRDIARELDELRELATRDPLTKLPNRRALLAHLFGVIERGASVNGWVAVAVLDLDHFKSVNDDHGHPVGDAVLNQVGRILAGFIAPNTFVGRLGGEEFMVVLTDLSPPLAKARVEEIRMAVAAYGFATRDGKQLSLTLSAGLAMAAGKHLRMERLYDHADKAAYQAKREGRNRIVTAELGDPESALLE